MRAEDEGHETSDAVRGDLHGTPDEWPERQPTDPDRGQLRDAATPASGRGRQSEHDVERLQAAIDKAYGAMNSSTYVGGPSEREAWQTAMTALGEVVTQHKGQNSPASTGDARGDDERPGAHLPFGGDGQDYPARSPQGEDHEEA